VIHIASTTFDLLGHVSIDPLPGAQSYRRRAARAATLDGGAVVSDRGYSDGDLTRQYRWRVVSRAHTERVRRIVKLHPTVTLSSAEGCFLAVPESMDEGPDENTLTLLVIRTLSED